MHLTRSLDRDEGGWLLWTAQSADGQYEVDLAWNDGAPGLDLWVTVRDARSGQVVYDSSVVLPDEPEPLSDEQAAALQEYDALDERDAEVRTQLLRLRRRTEPEKYEALTADLDVITDQLHALERQYGAAWEAYEDRSAAYRDFYEDWEVALHYRTRNRLFRLLVEHDPTVAAYLSA